MNMNTWIVYNWMRLQTGLNIGKRELIVASGTILLGKQIENC